MARIRKQEEQEQERTEETERRRKGKLLFSVKPRSQALPGNARSWRLCLRHVKSRGRASRTSVPRQSLGTRVFLCSLCRLLLNSFSRKPMSTTLLDKRETRIRRMFGDIAPRYDLLNHLLSLNVDRYWRWRTTRLVPPGGTGPILDLCTGTGDLALAYDRAADRQVPVVGADFCHEMLIRAV